RVLLSLHKEQMLDAVEPRFPADHYVMVDDKLRILAAMKQVWRERLTTVFVRQGHYALDARALQAYQPADLTLAHIGQLVDCSLGLVPCDGHGQRLGSRQTAPEASAVAGRKDRRSTCRQTRR